MGRLTWRLFGVLIAVPALALAWLGLGAVRAERLEADQQLRGRQRQLAQLADAAILTALTQFQTGLGPTLAGREESPPTLPAGVTPVRFQGAGVVTFPRDRVYFGPFGRHPPERSRLTDWPGTVSRLVDEAQAAEVQGRPADALTLLQRIRRAEPRLQAWAEMMRARVRLRGGSRSALTELTNTSWSRSAGVTPSGLPVAFLACAVVDGRPAADRGSFAPLVERTLAELRGGRWWLSDDERRFYDAQLRELLPRPSGLSPPLDNRLGELAEIEAVVRQAPPTRRNAPTYAIERGPTSAFLMIWLPSDGEPDAWSGAAVRQNEAQFLIGPALERLFADQPFHGAIRTTDGTVVWRTAADPGAPWHTEALSAIDDWELVFSGPTDAGAVGRRQWLWYGFVVLMLVVLFAAAGMTAHTMRREMELARMQSDFIAAVTHEFKSPLTSIRLLLERIAGGRMVSPQVMATYCDAIGQETERLERLVNRLLEAQQIEAGERQYRAAPAAIDELTAEVIRHMQPAADAKGIGIDLKIEPPVPPVSIDRMHISDAIENLVDNAIKYSPANTRIVVRVHVEGERVCVDVEDQGIGIDRDEIERIFDKFYRGRRGDRQNVRGTGLGLALVKAAAEAHGGSVAVSSQPGAGSRFSLRLPA